MTEEPGGDEKMKGEEGDPAAKKPVLEGSQPGSKSFAKGLEAKEEGAYVGQRNQAGQYDGQGTMKYANGDVYVGSWKNGERDGQGTMTYASGSTYTGSWRFGLYHGEGTLFDGVSMRKGNWVDGKLGDENLIGAPPPYEPGDNHLFGFAARQRSLFGFGWEPGANLGIGAPPPGPPPAYGVAMGGAAGAAALTAGGPLPVAPPKKVEPTTNGCLGCVFGLRVLCVPWIALAIAIIGQIHQDKIPHHTADFALMQNCWENGSMMATHKTYLLIRTTDDDYSAFFNQLNISSPSHTPVPADRQFSVDPTMIRYVSAARWISWLVVAFLDTAAGVLTPLWLAIHLRFVCMLHVCMLGATSVLGIGCVENENSCLYLDRGKAMLSLWVACMVAIMVSVAASCCSGCQSNKKSDQPQQQQQLQQNSPNKCCAYLDVILVYIFGICSFLLVIFVVQKSHGDATLLLIVLIWIVVEILLMLMCPPKVPPQPVQPPQASV